MTVPLQADVQDNWTAKLNLGVDNAIGTFEVSQTGETGTRPFVPFFFNVEAEKVYVTQIDIDTPSAGIDTFTVLRGQLDSSPASHVANKICVQRAYSIQIRNIHEDLYSLMSMFFRQFGGKEDGVQRTGAYLTEDLVVVAQGTPNMTVTVKEGAAIVSRKVVGLLGDITPPVFVAPSVDPRIDIVQLNQARGISIRTGAENASPVAPTVDSDKIVLSEIFHRVGETSIKDADDSTNGFITDKRGTAGTPWL